MAKCQGEGCGRDIPDGEKYCPACEEKYDQKSKKWWEWGLGGIILLLGGVALLLGGKKDN